MTDNNFPLKYPIVREGAETISVLKGRRAKVRDMQKFLKMLDTGDSSKAMMEVLSDLFAVQISVINDLDIEDYAPMMKWFQAFLEPMKSASED